MKHSIIEHENYNKSKSENAKQPQCPKEKEEAIVEALKHFRML
jgi:23S rRNA (uracil1939-C5)-methyltransferase